MAVPSRPPGGVRPPPPASGRRLLLSPPHRTAGSEPRARKAPSEVRAKPPARLEIAPRPPGAPPPAWAPPRGSGGDQGGPAGRGSLRRSAGASRELTGAAPTRALRLLRPHRLSAEKESPLGAARRPQGWGLSCRGPRASPGFPESWTPGCHLAPERGQSAATATVGRTLAPTREEDRASSERAVITDEQGCAPRIRRFAHPGLAK